MTRDIKNGDKVKAPKFNCNRMDGVIVLTLDMEMARSLLSLMRDFYSDELNTAEFALMRRLESIIEQRRSRSEQPEVAKIEEANG